MNVMKKAAALARQLGGIPGESAKAWRERDPIAAAKFAEFIKMHSSELSRAISNSQRENLK